MEDGRQAIDDLEKMEPLPPEPLPTETTHPTDHTPEQITMPDSEKKGIQETTDLAEAAETLAVEIIQRVRDGVQPSDAVSLALDGDVHEDLIAAAEGITEVPGELADLSAEEARTLAQRGLGIPFRIFDALKS